MRTGRALWAALACLAVFSTGAGRAVAEGPDGGVAAKADATAEITVLHATNGPDGGAGIDPRIGNVPALSRPPFSSYNSYALLSRAKIPLKRGAPATTTLPNGRVLQIVLQRLLPKERFRVTASIDQPGAGAFLPLMEVTAPAGEPFFVAGQSYRGGMLVVGIAVAP